MSDYILIQSRDPHESRSAETFYKFAGALVDNGSSVTLFLVQDGVFAAREGSQSSALATIAKAGVEVLADDFSLKERGISANAVISGVMAAPLDTVVDQLAAGRKAIWH